MQSEGGREHEGHEAEDLDESELGIATLEHLVEALVMESVRSRLRHRALLHALANAGCVDLSEYVKAYQKEEEQNFSPLLAMLMLPPEQFEAQHRDWLEQDRKIFGLPTSSGQSVELRTVESESPAAVPGDANSETKKPKRKKP